MPANLGEFEQIVLLALIHLRDDAYGVAVRDEIERRTGRTPDFGAVYSTLRRLEAKGLVRSRLGEPTPERGGRRKKFYTPTPAGTHALAESLRAIRVMSKGLGPRLEIP
jgi:DNA-binding PadR family transcriptional regulator